MNVKLQRGDIVELLEKPTGCTSQHYDLTVGDFYRFNDPREWEDAGFRDLFASPGLKLAEWPEQAAAALPMPDLSVQIDTQADDTRHVTLTAHSITGMGLLP